MKLAVAHWLLTLLPMHLVVEHWLLTLLTQSAELQPQPVGNFFLMRFVTKDLYLSFT